MDHIDQLSREIISFHATKPYRVIDKYEMKSGQEHFTFRIHVSKEPPQRLGIIAGDCVNQLRSILDNIIWELAGIHCPKRKGVIAFPICWCPKHYQSALKTPKFEGINEFPSAIRRLIEDLQPYNRGNAGKSASHPLFVLNALWNADKHHSPALTYTVGVVDMNGWPSVGNTLRIAVTDGAILSQGIVPNPKPNQNPKVSLHIALDIRSSPGNKLAANVYLRTLHEYIRDYVISEFEPMFFIPPGVP